MEAGASIEARNEGGHTPLHEAAEGPSVKALLALLKHGADINAQNVREETALHWAAKTAGRQGIAEVVDSLLRSGADEAILNDDDETAAEVELLMSEEEGYEEEERLAEDVERVLNAPADKAWRRRGYMVLCRAHQDRLAGADTTKTEEAVKERATGDWCLRVLELREEGVGRSWGIIFKTGELKFRYHLTSVKTNPRYDRIWSHISFKIDLAHNARLTLYLCAMFPFRPRPIHGEIHEQAGTEVMGKCSWASSNSL